MQVMRDKDNAHRGAVRNKNGRRGTPRSRGAARVVALLASVVMIAAGCAEDSPPVTTPPVDPTIISLGDSGTPGNTAVTQAAMSADGNIVAFVSDATDLVAGPATDTSDLYVRNRSAGTTVRIAEQVRSLSQVTPNGRYVAYTTTIEDPVSYDVELGFAVHDTTTGTTNSWVAAWPAGAGDLLAVDATGSTLLYGHHKGLAGLGTSHCIVRDLTNGSETNCPTRGSGIGTTGLLAVSSNARYALYTWVDNEEYDENATVLWDRQSNTTTKVNPGTMQLFSNARFSLSDNGQALVGEALDVVDVDGESANAIVTVHVNLTNGATKAFDYTQVLGGTTVGGVSAHAISPDGKSVVLQSYQHPFDPTRDGIWSDVYVWNVSTNSVSRVGSDLSAGTPNVTTIPCVGASMLANGSGMCVIVATAMGESPIPPADSDAWLVARP